MSRKKTLVLDFDGVIHSYASGWKGVDVIPDPPVPGALDFIERAVAKFQVCIYSSRSASLAGRMAMMEWLTDWCKLNRKPDLTPLVLWPQSKPAAHLSIDDRGYQFNGVWPQLDYIENFQPWNKT